MDNIIKSLVEVDALCSKQISQAKAQKSTIQAKVNAKKDEIYQEYFDKITKDLENHKERLNQEILIASKEKENTYQASLDKMEQIFNDNKDSWVNQIVGRCINKEG